MCQVSFFDTAGNEFAKIKTNAGMTIQHELRDGEEIIGIYGTKG